MKFELSRSALSGIVIVAFCLFMWTFIFGVWAGQSMLSKPGATEKSSSSKKNSSSVHLNKTIQIVPMSSPQKKDTAPVEIKAEKKAIKKGT